jgi:hypothetical protein
MTCILTVYLLQFYIMKINPKWQAILADEIETYFPN